MRVATKNKIESVAESKVMASVGTKCTGKSTRILAGLLETVRGNSKRGIKPRKVIIFDINDEYGDKEMLDGSRINVKRIYLCDIPKFQKQELVEIRRVIPHVGERKMTDGELRDAVEYVCDNFRDVDGIIFFDSCEYIPPTLIPKLCVAHRIHRQSLIFAFQSLSRIMPCILPCLDGIILHKTNDRFWFCQENFGEYFEIISIARMIVNNLVENQKEKYALVYVDLVNSTITGRFSYEDMAISIHYYVSVNNIVEKAMKNKIMRKNLKTIKGKKGTYAMWEFITENLTDKYFPKEQKLIG